MKKKVLAALLGLVIAVSMAACGGSDPSTGSSAASNAPASEMPSSEAPTEEISTEDSSENPAGDEAFNFADPGEFVTVEAHGLYLDVPASFVLLSDGSDGGYASYRSPDTEFLVQHTPKMTDQEDPSSLPAVFAAELTEEVGTALFEKFGWTDIQDLLVVNDQAAYDGTEMFIVVANATSPNVPDRKATVAMQWYIPQDNSGYYLITWVYPEESEEADVLCLELAKRVTVAQ